MSRRDPLVYIHEMQDYAIEARDLAAGRSRPDLDADRMFNLALTKLLELAGDKTRRVPDDFRARYPHARWDETRGFRSRLALNDRGRIDFDAAWDIIQNEIPPLIESLEAILVQEGCRDERAQPRGHDHPR